ncbi:MAG: cob(I)yrinic acid a,c-diamide adenosyltransferase [Planctomycetes bacterium]|nr:cob(I)yrinic acid a,c-diamide adenosyltransferase [Planctomycetota bacterium]
MPIYTGTGDEGDTGLFGNRRVPKDHTRIEAYGTVDELNSWIGLLRAEPLEPGWDGELKTVQDELFELGADLATEGGAASLPRIEPAITRLERWIDASERELPPLHSFVLPGGCREAALLHVLRTVARRAERRFWHLARAADAPGQHVPPAIGIYLNRLSDLFFSWARRANHRAGRADVPWTRR